MIYKNTFVYSTLITLFITIRLNCKITYKYVFKLKQRLNCFEITPYAAEILTVYGNEGDNSLGEIFQTFF